MRKQFSSLFRGSCDNMLLYPFSWRVDMSCKRWIANKKWKMLQQSGLISLDQPNWMSHSSFHQIGLLYLPCDFEDSGVLNSSSFSRKIHHPYLQIPLPISQGRSQNSFIAKVIWIKLFKFHLNFESKPLQKLHHSTVMSSILSDSFHLFTMKQMDMEKGLQYKPPLECHRFIQHH